MIIGILLFVAFLNGASMAWHMDHKSYVIGVSNMLTLIGCLVIAYRENRINTNSGE